MDKQSLRLQLKDIRKNIENRADKDKKIADNIFKLIENKRDILIYINAFTEVNTLNLCKKLLEQNVNVYAPKCMNDNDMIFYKIEKLSDLQKGKYGILEPSENLPIFHLKEKLFCLVPGLGFDLKGNRIGYGKGYYDKFLSENNLLSVGVCYSEQITKSIPTTKHDQKLNFIITDKFVKEI